MKMIPAMFIERVVTQDETWAHHFDPQSKMKSKQWKHPGSPPPTKFMRVHSAGKIMASIFWDSQGVIMIDYLEQGRIICRRIEAATPGNRKKNSSCHGCCDDNLHI